MAKVLKTTGIYANLVAAIGVDDDNTTVRDFKTPGRTITLGAGATLVDGHYGRAVRVSSAAGEFVPRGIELSPGIVHQNNSGARTIVIIFNSYTHTKNTRLYYQLDTAGGNGFRIGGGGTDGEYPRLWFSSGSMLFQSAKNIQNVRSLVAMAIDLGASKQQRFWVARNGETFPVAPEHSGTNTSTALATDTVSILGGTSSGSQLADWFLYLEFSAFLSHADIETIYNSLTGSGACDCFVPPAAPTISAHPTNQTVTAPATATFSVTATGSGVIYQWERLPFGSSTWANVGTASSTAPYTTGATSVTGGSFNHGDQFRVTASNGGGSVTSNPATLTVNAPADTTPPSWGSSSLSASNVTLSSFTVTAFEPAVDNVAVTGYETSFDGGSTYTTNSPATSLTRNYTGGTPGATVQVRMRAFDAAGNRSPALSLAVTLANTTITFGPFGSSGTLWAVGTPVHLTWYPAGRVGSLGAIAGVDRNGTLGANGLWQVQGLPAGAGFGMVAKRNTGATDDDVAYQPGTVVQS